MDQTQEFRDNASRELRANTVAITVIYFHAALG